MTSRASSISRFGISVKKLGWRSAAESHSPPHQRILRRNRTEIPSGWDIVIHPRRSVAQAPFAPLEAELVRLLRSISPRADLGARGLLVGIRCIRCFFRLDAKRLQVLPFLFRVRRDCCTAPRRAPRVMARHAPPCACHPFTRGVDLVPDATDCPCEGMPRPYAISRMRDPMREIRAVAIALSLVLRLLVIRQNTRSHS